MKISTLVFAVAAATLPGSCGAQGEDHAWLRPVLAQLDSVTESLGAQGLSPVGEQHAARLPEFDSREFDLRLPAGSYRIVGVCDADCDVDLVLARDGVEVARDVEVYDTPVLTVRVPEAGTLVVRVIMGTCGFADGCAWGVGVYGTGG
jgi:hypothetical protein